MCHFRNKQKVNFVGNNMFLFNNTCIIFFINSCNNRGIPGFLFSGQSKITLCLSCQKVKLGLKKGRKDFIPGTKGTYSITSHVK
jgi:hypothetical protein